MGIFQKHSLSLSAQMESAPTFLQDVEPADSTGSALPQPFVHTVRVVFVDAWQQPEPLSDQELPLAD
eukprot:15943192-Heterocapsa_arctica.AAC.1